MPDGVQTLCGGIDPCVWLLCIPSVLLMTKIFLEMFVLTPFGHLTWLVAREEFVMFSRSRNSRSYILFLTVITEQRIITLQLSLLYKPSKIIMVYEQC